MQTSLLKFTGKVSRICKRDIGVFAPAFQKANDPIQQLFVDKIREYKSKTAGGKSLSDIPPEMKKELENDRARVFRQFNVKPGEDLSKFPSQKFDEPKLEKPDF